jgi:hypothetical protein
MQNGKVGEGDVFLKKNAFIALIALKFRYKIIAITSSNPQSLE